ncbi:ABC transporter ATP-binding protein [Alloiococcus sp. CFN-8]|uniref:ABC transporter ATP-binding protein n=1 Tax=Alloiococcus sp. CFN-8 TaxID=3416081 RepID=UPI003CE928B5
MSVEIKIDNVVKKYGKDIVINKLSLNIKPGEFFTLLGPSGCGKTTLLRMIIGFNSIEEGDIFIDNRRINDIPTSKRNMGMVFQNYAIFPHMSVEDNVAFGLKNRKVNKEEIKKRVDEILRIVKIDHLKERMPAKLSGGQQQRIALARALVINPEVLLMDEPLSNLDAKLRVEMRNVIKRIHDSIGVTTVYVTHDQEEALAISDRIAVMYNGIIQQIGTPKEIYQRPANVFVSTFIGVSNIIEVNLEAIGNKKLLVFSSDYTEVIENISEEAVSGEKVVLSVRPEEFIISNDGRGIKGIVRSSIFLGMTIHYFVELKDGSEVEVIQIIDNQDIIADGSEIFLKVNTDRVNVFNKETGNSLIREVYCIAQ